MAQFQVNMFQRARVCTESFMVEADSAEDAKRKVEMEDIAKKDLNAGEYELEASEVDNGQPMPQGIVNPSENDNPSI